MRGRPVSNPDAVCLECGSAFHIRTRSNANKYCSRTCANAKRCHPPEFVEAARTLWDQGLSRPEVAIRLGVPPNVIAGVAWRYRFTPAHLRGRMTA